MKSQTKGAAMKRLWQRLAAAMGALGRTRRPHDDDTPTLGGNPRVLDDEPRTKENTTMSDYRPTRDGMKDALVLARALLTCDHDATQAVMANCEPTELVCSLVSLLAGEITTHYDGRTLAVIAGRIASVDALFDRHES